MAAYTEDSENVFDYETEWLETAGDVEQGGTHFADEAQEDTLLGYIPWNKRRSALRFFKGFAYADDSSPFLLHREQPHRHPDFPWLRAYDVSFKGTVLKANPDNPNFSPYDVTPFTLDPVTRRTRYTHAVCTVRYRSFGDMLFLEDSDIEDPADEWFRNTSYLPIEPSVEALTITGGMSQLKFAETGTGGPTVGTPFTAPLPELQMKVGFKLLWKCVPWEYVSSEDDYFWPQKVLDCMGKINDADFLGNIDAGTVYMDAMHATVYPFWVASDDDRGPLLAADFVLSFKHFDPTRGATSPTKRGWNLMPWGGNGINNGDGQYYLATRDGDPDGAGLLQSANFNDMFTHVLRP